MPLFLRMSAGRTFSAMPRVEHTGLSIVGKIFRQPHFFNAARGMLASWSSFDTRKAVFHGSILVQTYGTPQRLISLICVLAPKPTIYDPLAAGETSTWPFAICFQPTPLTRCSMPKSDPAAFSPHGATKQTVISFLSSGAFLGTGTNIHLSAPAPSGVPFSEHRNNIRKYRLSARVVSAARRFLVDSPRL